MDDRTEQRLEALEVKTTYTEDLVDRLNDIIVRQQQQLERLTEQLRGLMQQQTGAADGPVFRSLRDELPPHY